MSYSSEKPNPVKHPFNSPSCEIITIGTELLLGQITDTNSVYLARELGRMGITVRFRTAVGDRLEEIIRVIQLACERCDLVITTGGLGPTRDDLTREAVARAAGVALEFRQELMAQIAEVFERNGFQMPENNRLQAFVPAGGLGIQNRVGTAPGFVKEVNEKPVVCLPGVPRELEYLLMHEVKPLLQERFGLSGQRVIYRVLKTVGLSESRVDSIIGDLMISGAEPEVGLLASQGEIKIRIAVSGKNEPEARRLIDPVADEIRSRLGTKIFGEENDTLEGVIDSLLAEKGLTVAILETFSGGSAAQKFHALPESRLVESLVISDKKRLGQWLGRKDPALSIETSTAVAQYLRQICRADMGLAILGFPEKRQEDFYLEYHAGIAGEGIETGLSREMGGDLSMLRQRGIILGLDALRLALLDNR